MVRFTNIIKYYFRKLRRKITYYNIHIYPNIFRPTSKPFISGDTFRDYSNHIHDETQGFDLKKVKKNDIIFLKSELIDTFFNYFHPKIKEPYILITHNSDFIIEEKHLSYKDDLIIHWFAQNLNFPNNDGVSVLPIGLENKRYLNNGVLRDFKNYQNQKKNSHILCSFNENTHPERGEVLSVIENNIYVDIANFKSHKEYIKNMSQYKFNLCPRGNGHDTHRFWESLMVGTFPIVERNSFTTNMENMGIPAIYLDSWNQLNSYDINNLNDIFIKLTKKDKDKYLSFEFWKENINSKVLS